MGKDLQASAPGVCGFTSVNAQGMRNILTFCRNATDIRMVTQLFRNMGVEIKKSDFNSNLDKINELMKKGDVQIGASNQQNNSLFSTIDNQHKTLLKKKDDLSNKIKNSERSISIKEVEFLDTRKEAGEVQKFGKFFTSQDYTLAIFICGYIFLSLAAYWRISYHEGISLKITSIFLLAWIIVSGILVSVLNNFV
jgi:hypothetical protein